MLRSVLRVFKDTDGLSGDSSSGKQAELSQQCMALTAFCYYTAYKNRNFSAE
jgi:hypothetical protein